MTIEAVVFDWGGTLSVYADIELIDMWYLAAERLGRETGRDPSELRAAVLQLMAASDVSSAIAQAGEARVEMPMRMIAQVICAALSDDFESERDALKARTKALADAYPLYPRLTAATV